MLLAPLPALVVGVLLMRRTGVSSTIWGQQLAAGLTLMILCIVLRGAARATSRSRWGWAIAGSVSLLLLIATLLNTDIDGVRRWVAIGPVQLHAAFIALPVLIIIFCRATRWVLLSGVAVVAGVLVLQPDASQAIAFAVAVATVLFVSRPAGRGDWVALGIVSVCAALSLSRPDPLDAVPHVEGIVGLAASAGAGWLIAAIIALVLLPVPFITYAVRRRDRAREGMALAAYFITVCIASLLAPFPVPLLGFGLSPILGYYAALCWSLSQLLGNAHQE